MQSEQQPALVAPAHFRCRAERWFDVGDARRRVYVFERL
jgi:hypothetical protein